ncbi:hypothetical protein KC19_VG241100 [Ceratodon purpureus]|uniref:Uncharacterized protein n=1 Tax=Ceratodon purpureus TaxID=3225 RepID=A0A8T0HTW2_CERPU|nr:hypothetical protein KC19_VG241100 [Ceratodon purpureus]
MLFWLVQTGLINLACRTCCSRGGQNHMESVFYLHSCRDIRWILGWFSCLVDVHPAFQPLEFVESTEDKYAFAVIIKQELREPAHRWRELTNLEPFL